jgi:hypothetical protein
MFTNKNVSSVPLATIRQFAENARGQINHIYLHWSAGHYGQFFEDYHLNIDSDGNIYPSTQDFTEKLAHTWHRNTGAIGIAMACCAGATTEDLGNEPPTNQQIESMAQLVAVLCDTLGLPIDSEHVMTHCEAAEEDGYGPSTTCERWDLLFLSNESKEVNGGDTLRGKAIWYQQNS